MAKGALLDTPKAATVGSGAPNALAGTLTERNALLNVPQLVTAYYTGVPDASVPRERVAFGTSGHRGSSLTRAFNEAHILAIVQAICLYRAWQKVSGPLFLGVDTHALSAPAAATALEVLAANGVDVIIAERNEYTPTPVISHAILAHNRSLERGRADGIVVTPSHNPPEDGGIKYNPPHGGPADTSATAWIQDKANSLLETRLQGVRRIPYAQALRASTTHLRDYVTAYVDDLGSVLDLDLIRQANLRLGVDPLGGAGVHYWPRIAERYGLDLTVVDDTIDPTFGFITRDWDGQIRMDPSSPYAVTRLVGMKDRFDLSFACDTDHDRHGIVSKSAGLLPPNHFLAVAASYLFRNRPRWPAAAALGKSVVSSALLDRIAGQVGRTLFEAPVGFKWFVAGLLDSSIGFAGEESAGASFLRLDGHTWTTDKDGIVPCLLAAELMARSGRDPGETYIALAQELGAPLYIRVETRGTLEEKAALMALSAKQLDLHELAGESVRSVLTHAPGNGAPIGGLKVTTASGWIAARPSGTENIIKIYAESFRDEDHLRQLVEAARAVVKVALAAAPPERSSTARTDRVAVEVWENEGDPN